MDYSFGGQSIMKFSYGNRFPSVCINKLIVRGKITGAVQIADLASVLTSSRPAVFWTVKVQNPVLALGDIWPCPADV